MLHTINPASHSDLLLPRIIAGAMLLVLATIVTLCQLGIVPQEPMPEDTRVVLRTVLYALSIVTFPLTNLIRFIQMRLNQTMPRTLMDCKAEAKKRYFTTVVVSLSMVESIAIYGLVMFVMGDGFNTLYILTGLSALGMILYRPKLSELNTIIEALATQTHE